MKLPLRWTKNTLIFGGIAAWGLLLVSCVSVNRAVLAPPSVPGAKFAGTKACSECHAEMTEHFTTATHANLALADDKVGDTGCESCHGPGSSHVKAGGGAGTIVNPGKSPETCFACHLDKRGEFSLPNAHPVLAGKIGCADCHDPHQGKVIKRTGAELETPNETCTKCHTSQKGPFLFPHQAMQEGCTACHNPHGTVNQKMLVARDSNLCLRCHLEHPAVIAGGILGDGKIVAGGEDHRSRLQGGTCWSAGCHEDVHGSNASKAMRY
jgi:predicted CXXCH cytochrome family protein